MTFPFIIQYLQKYRLMVLSIAIFSVTFSYALYYQIPPVVDAKAYDNIAQNIVAGNGYREDSVDTPILFDRSIQRAGPAYEYVLSAIYLVFGHSLVAVWFFQALMHALTALLIYGIARAVFSERGESIGIVAIAIFGFHPDLIENAAMLLTETWFLFISTVAVYCFVKYIKKNQFGYLFALAESLALAFLTRPTIALIGVVAAWVLVSAREWKRLAIFTIIGLATIAPWSYRNYKVYHEFIPTTVIGGYNLWLGNTATSNGGQLASGYNPWDEHVEVFGFAHIKNVASNNFASFVKNNPTTFVKLTFIRTVRFFSLVRPLGFWFYNSGISQTIFVALSGVSIAFLFIFGSIGLLAALREHNTSIKYLAAFTITIPLPLLITVAQSRYRFPIYPFFALFAAYAIVSIKNKTLFLRSKIPVLVVLFFAVVSIFDVVLNSTVVIDRIKSLI